MNRVLTAALSGFPPSANHNSRNRPICLAVEFLGVIKSENVDE